MKPERDPTTCEVSECEEEANTATPAGPLCSEHAESFERVTEAFE